MRARVITAAGLSVAAMDGAPLANAQTGPRVGERFGDWTYACGAVAEGVTDCALTQTLFAGDDRRRVAQFNIGKDPQSGDLRMTALVTLGLELEVGLSGTIDDDTPFAIPLETCLPQGCIGRVDLNPDLRRQFEDGDVITLNFVILAGARPVTLGGSLNGVTAALDATGW